MLIMTPSSTILTGEDEEEHRTPWSTPKEDDTATHSNRRRWSTPVGSGGDSVQESLSVEIKSSDEKEIRGVSAGVNLDEYFCCPASVNNGYSFYLGGKESAWGQSRPPLLKESRRGRSVTRKRDLPPFLTTLDCNGRPRFHHRRVRSEGRLEIESVAVDSPEMVSVRGREGLRIGTVRISQDNEPEEEENEDEDDKQNH